MSMSVLAGAVPFVACSATSMVENLRRRERRSKLEDMKKQYAIQ